MKFEEIFGNAKWIAADPAVCPVIRRDFDASQVQSAELTILGFGSFMFYVNGVRGTDEYFLPLYSDFEPRNLPTGEDGGHRTYVGTYDITPFVRDGKNALAVFLGNSWYTGTYNEVPYGTQKLCYSLKLTDAQGTRVIVSDGSERWIPSFVKTSDLNKGETHDYSDWEESALLPSADMSAWSAVTEAKPLNTEYDLQRAPRDKASQCITPKLLHREGDVAVYDLGENISAVPVFQTTAESDAVTITVSEELLDGKPDPLYNQYQTFSFVTGHRAVTAAPMFTWLAFRYFSVEGKAEPTVVYKVHSDVAIDSAFDSDNSTLNWIYKTYLNTQLCNMHSGIPSDCPHLERRGYTGDGQLACHAAMLLLDGKAFYDKWIDDISDCQDRLTGHVQYTAPYTCCGGGPGGWGSAIVTVPYEYYLRFGDDSKIKAMYPQMLRYFDFLDAHSECDFVVSDTLGRWCLGDWCVPETLILAPPFVNNYFYVKSLERVIAIARLTGHEDDIPMLNDRMRRRKKAMTAAYFNLADSNFFGNRQGANAYALDIGLGDERTKTNFIEYYDKIGYYDTGIFATDIVTRLLFEYGRADIAYRLMTASEPHGFGKWQQLGATTLWEYWGGRRSHSHPMFGAPAAYLMDYILGIHQMPGTVGYTDVCIRPEMIEGLNRASGSLMTAHGAISVAYEKQNGTLKLTVSVPQGIRASVQLPNAEAVAVQGTQTFTAVL